MAPSPVCRVLKTQLSSFVDGELRSSERIPLEEHLASCTDCAGRVADLRAESALVRVAMELRADEVDWRDFTKGVMSRIAPERVPFAERWRVSLRELFTYRRGVMVSALAAAVAIIALAPVLLGGPAQDGYAREKLAVQSVSTSPDAHVAPVLMSGEHGNTIVWLVNHKHVIEGKAPPENSSDEVDSESAPQDLNRMNQERKRGGEL